MLPNPTAPSNEQFYTNDYFEHIDGFVRNLDEEKDICFFYELFYYFFYSFKDPCFNLQITY